MRIQGCVFTFKCTSTLHSSNCEPRTLWPADSRLARATLAWRATAPITVPIAAFSSDQRQTNLCASCHVASSRPWTQLQSYPCGAH
jgi:hypothetical protein